MVKNRMGTIACGHIVARISYILLAVTCTAPATTVNATLYTREEALKRKIVDKPISINKETIKVFEARTLAHNGWTVENGRLAPQMQNFEYRVHVPANIQQGRQYPLIVWLHGCGDERGWDNTSQLRYIEETLLRPSGEGEPFIILAPQCPLVPGMWYREHASAKGVVDGRQRDEFLPVVMEMLDQVSRECPVDPNRVSVVGVSCAANAALELGVRHPTRWASIAALSLDGIPWDHMTLMPDCPVWSFTNASDPFIDEEKLNALNQSVRQCNLHGSNVVLTVLHLPGWKHDCWHPAFDDWNLLEWLLHQDRGKSWKCPPGVRLQDWPWRQPFKEWTTTAMLSNLLVLTVITAMTSYLFVRLKRGTID